MESRLKCSICDKSFAKKYHLNEHQRKIHKYDPIPTKSYTCSFCSKKYTSNKSLLAHTQKFHNTNGNIIKRVNQSRIFCPYDNCQEVLLTLVRLRMHLTENHGIESELEEIQFNDETGNFFFTLKLF